MNVSSNAAASINHAIKAVGGGALELRAEKGTIAIGKQNIDLEMQ